MKTLTPFFITFLFTAMLFSAEPQKVQIIASPETTYYTEPQLPDGRIDYRAILHNLCSEGVTKENNIVAVLNTQFAGETERSLLLAAVKNQAMDAEAEKRIHIYREKAWKQLGFDAPPDWKTLQFGFFPGEVPNKDHKPELQKYYSPKELETLVETHNAKIRERYQKQLDDKIITQEEFDSLIEDIDAESYNTIVDDQWREALNTFWTEKDYPYLAEGIKKSDALIQKLIEHSKCTDYFHPYFAHSESELLHDVMLSYVDTFRRTIRFLALSGNFEFANGNVDQAFECAFAQIRLGNTIRKGSGWLVEELLGNALDGIGGVQVVRYLAEIDGKKDARWILQKKKEFETLYPIQFSDPPKWVRGERIIMLSAVQELAAGHKEILALLDEDDKKRYEETFVPGKEYDWNDIFRRCNALYDDLEDVQRIPDDLRRIRASSRLDERIKELRERYETEQDGTHRAGDLFLSALVWGYSAVDVAHCRTELLYDTASVAFALAAYRSEHDGKNPETLAQLVPKYMDSIPLSPFSGKPLRYFVRKDICFVTSSEKYKYDGSEPEVEKAIAETRIGYVSHFPFEPSSEHYVYVLHKGKE